MEEPLPKRCENCYHYYFEEDDDGIRYHYCCIFDCQICEIESRAGINPFIGCMYYFQMPRLGELARTEM